MARSNVVPIPGKAAYQARIPQPGVVEMLSDALKLAKRGEIQGAALCAVTSENTLTTDWASGAASANSMTAAISRLHFRMLRAATDD